MSYRIFQTIILAVMLLFLSFISKLELLAHYDGATAFALTLILFYALWVCSDELKLKMKQVV